MIQAFKDLKFSTQIVVTILMLVNLCVTNIFRHGSVALILMYIVILLTTNWNQSIFKDKFLRLDIKIIISLTLFIAWIAVSSLWSYDSAITLKTCLITLLCVVMTMTFLIALYNQTYFRPEYIIKFIMITAILASVILLIQQCLMNHGYPSLYQMFQHKWRSLKPNSELICILLVPCLTYLIVRKRLVMAAMLFTGMLYFAHYLEIKASYYGFILAAGVGLISLTNLRFIKYLLQVCMTVYVTTLPFVFNCFDKIDFSQYLKHNSSYYTLLHRFYIWDYVHNLTQQKPLLGWGGGISSRYSTTVHKFAYSDWSVFPSHPHNIFMQIWFELGSIGIIITVCFFWRWLDLIWQQPNRLYRSIHTFYFTHTLAILSISHSLWHSWWISWIAFGWVLTHYVTTQDHLNNVASSKVWLK